MCAAMRRSRPPTSSPPMKTAGTAGFLPTNLTRTFSISELPVPSPSSSSSNTAGLTPRPQKRRLTTWHMQQEVTLNTSTALSEARRCTLSKGLILIMAVLVIVSSSSSTELRPSCSVAAAGLLQAAEATVPGADDPPALYCKPCIMMTTMKTTFPLSPAPMRDESSTRLLDGRNGRRNRGGSYNINNHAAGCWNSRQAGTPYKQTVKV
jgi:hypothetical protein